MSNRLFRLILAILTGLSAYIIHHKGYPLIGGCLTVLTAFCFYSAITHPNDDTNQAKGGWFRLGPLSWTFGDYCRHWICVGRSGCGKTEAFIKAHLSEFLRAAPGGGGVLTDEKGDFRDVAEAIFKYQKFPERLRIVRVRLPEETTTPRWKMNLIGDRTIPYLTHAQLVVDVAISQGQKTSNAFFKTQGVNLIASAIETLALAKLPVTLENCGEFFIKSDQREQVILRLKNSENQAARDMFGFWERFFKEKAPEELSGILSTTENYLKPYCTPEIAEIFSASEPNCDFSDIENGIFICPSIPQVFLRERRYIIAFSKVAYYLRGLRRFDKPKEERDKLVKERPCTLYADEGQNSILASEEGMSDINTLDKLRAAGFTVVFAMQGYSSAIPPIENEKKAEVLFTNLNNHVIFALNDETSRKMASEGIGKHEIWQRTYTSSARGGPSVSRKKEEKAIYPTYFFRKLKNFHCLIAHCQGAVIQTVLPPVQDDGKTPAEWYEPNPFRAVLRFLKIRRA